jgi:hypothetical protein
VTRCGASLPLGHAFCSLFIMNEIDYKELWQEIKKFFTLELNYTKLTAVEKLSVILSAVAFIGVLMILGACLLFYASTALVFLISDLIGCTWGAYLIVAGVLILLMFIVAAFKKKLIINPVTKFLTKLFLNPKDNE